MILRSTNSAPYAPIIELYNLIMSKKLILFLISTKFREIDFLRYDIPELEKKFNVKVEIHELIKILHPRFSRAFNRNKKFKKVKSFSSLNAWSKNFEKIQKKYNNFLIIKSFNTLNFCALKINLLIKNSKAKTLEFSTTRAPLYNKKNTIINNLNLTFFNLILYPKKILIFIQYKFFLNFSKFFDFSPNFFLTCGSQSPIVENRNKNTKVIQGNSFDFNMYLKSKNKKIGNNYGLFLEAPTPLFDGDTHLLGVDKHYLCTPEKWFKSLNKFFNLIEKYKGIKIKIAPHPKVKHKSKYPKYYYGREIIDYNLSEVAKNSQVLISRDSFGLSFAAIHNKPAIFIYNNEFLEKKNNFLGNQKIYATELGLEPINIDTLTDPKKISHLFKFNKNIYSKYKKKYLTNRIDNKINYEIIGKLI